MNKTHTIRVTIDLEVEFNTSDIVYKHNNIGLINQVVFDEFSHFAMCAHLRYATKYLSKSKEDKKSIDWRIYKHHETWADIIEKAEKTMKVEILDL